MHATPPAAHGGGAMLSNGAERMPVPSGGGEAGRGLAAYRSLPVPIAGRPPLARALLAAGGQPGRFGARPGLIR